MVGTMPGTMKNRWNHGTVGGGMAETMGTMGNKDRNNGTKTGTMEQRAEQ